MVTGEAGIGKTTLVRAVVRDRPERILWGACEPLTTTQPLLPLHDWGLHDLSLHAPGPDPADNPAVGRHDVFVDTLERLSAEPTIAVVEDVHWADDGTLDLLVFLSRRITGSATTLVVTARDDDATRSARVAAVLHHLCAQSATRRLVVPPLSADEVAALAEGSGLDAARIHDVTGGNAFFAAELVAAPGTGVPESVRDAIAARLAPLSPGARSAAETVAVMPGRASLDIVFAAASATSADLDEAERAGVLTSDGATVGFRHELAREAVEQALPGALTQSRHRAVLAALAPTPVRPRPRSPITQTSPATTSSRFRPGWRRRGDRCATGPAGRRACSSPAPAATSRTPSRGSRSTCCGCAPRQ